MINVFFFLLVFLSDLSLLVYRNAKKKFCVLVSCNFAKFIDEL